MLEKLYAMTEDGKQETKSVMDFVRDFIKTDDAEDKFYTAVRDSRLAGFQEGMRAALQLLTEVRA